MISFKELLRFYQKNNTVHSILKGIVPNSIYANTANYMRRDNDIKIYINNHIVTIDRKTGDTKGFVFVLYWDGKPNFGDLIGPYLISKITNKPVLNITKECDSGFMTVGSILQLIDRKNMVVWGSGFIQNPTEEVINNIKRFSPEILSVRGKKTVEYLVEANISIPENIVYGDPALILPLFYEPLLKGPKKIGVCPHFMHKSNFLAEIVQDDFIKIIDVQTDVESAVDAISSSSVCISTSLHGLIIAQAYGIPWVWLEIYDKNLLGNDFKFKDFFSTLNEEQVTHVKVKLEDIKNINYKEIAERATLPEKNYNESLILHALKKYLNKNTDISQ